MYPCAESSERNKGPILAVLKEVFADTRSVLEIGCGTGQHAVYFARNLPHLSWQPSDKPGEIRWIEARLERQRPDNVRTPVEIDVRDRPWGVDVDGIFTANTLHIMSWAEVEEFFRGVGESLRRPGTLCVYGPFRYDGAYSGESDVRFDRSLRQRGPQMGIRDFEAVDALAAEQGLVLFADFPMPANNRTLVWRRDRE